MDKVYDRFKVINGVLCVDGEVVNLNKLAAKLNNQDKVLAEVEEQRILWDKDHEAASKRGKIAHEAFMEKMEAKKVKVKEKHDLRMAKAKEDREAGMEFLAKMDIDLAKLRERMKAIKK